MEYNNINEYYNNLKEKVINLLVEGVDYGKVMDKQKGPCLLKPGAEKLCMAFGYTVNYHIEDKETEYERVFLFRASIYDKNDRKITDGFGSFSTAETLDHADLLTEEGIMALKTAKILGSNTAIKMAQKRALVAAVLLATGTSELFTQDLEDMKTVKVDKIKEILKARKKEVVEDSDLENPDYQYALDRIKQSDTKEQLENIKDKLTAWGRLDKKQEIKIVKIIDNKIQNLSKIPLG